MASPEPDTDELVRRMADGDKLAAELLLGRHRDRLRQMVAIRIDPRLTARLDPSDVVQEVLMVASRKLPEYMRQRALPFYPWLRQIAWNTLVDLHRRHIQAKTRSVSREQPWVMAISDQSAIELAERLAASGTSPSGRLIRSELRRRVRWALAQLPGRDREVLVMRHLEHLSISEMAAVMEIPEGTVKSRHFRALEQLRGLLRDELAEDGS